MDIELARQQWHEVSRRVERTRGEPTRYAHLHWQIGVVSAELRRRLGQTFTLDELADIYSAADEWTRVVLHAADPEGPPPMEATTVADAAFFLYARGASDYTP